MIGKKNLRERFGGKKMSKIEKATVHYVGDSKMVLIPAKLQKDIDYPFKKTDEDGLLIEIGKDSKGRKGLFIRRI